MKMSKSAHYKENGFQFTIPCLSKGHPTLTIRHSNQEDKIALDSVKQASKALKMVYQYEDSSKNARNLRCWKRLEKIRAILGYPYTKPFVL